jgi:hypothetical protein
MHLFEMQTRMARVIAEQPVGTSRLSLNLRRKRRKGVAEPGRSSRAHDALRGTLERVGIERLRPALAMLDDRLIREALKVRRRFAKLPIPALVPFHLREDGGSERILLGFGQFGNGSQCLVKKLGHRWSIAAGRR